MVLYLAPLVLFMETKMMQKSVTKPWLKATDIFMVYGRFRYIIELLKSSGHEPQTRSFLKAGQSQHESSKPNAGNRFSKAR